MKVTERLKAPIQHAISCGDKVLLNRIELEIVRDLGIQPTAEAIADPREEGNKWEAVAITSLGNELAVLWHSNTECDCGECDGTGMLRARGNKRSYEMECPECDGTGKGETDVRFSCWSDIDGEKLAIDAPSERDIEIQIGMRFDPLREFYKKEKAKGEQP
jgi:hypothetical protein